MNTARDNKKTANKPGRIHRMLRLEVMEQHMVAGRNGFYCRH